MEQTELSLGRANTGRFDRWLAPLLILAILSIAPSGSFAQLVSTYNSSGTFVVPAGVSQVTVECWGGGGRGGARTTNGRGGGGGGGAYVRSVISVTEGSTYTVTVGTGSTGTGAGGDSWFSTASTVMAKGGSSAGNNNANGASGGAAASSIGTFKFAGGNGANAPSGTGGGGGSSAGTAAAGNSSTVQAGASAPSGGGAGGDGGNGTFADGEAGSTPGGGGGGGERGCCFDVAGGNGANGRVVLTYTPCTGPTVSVSPTAPTICAGQSVTLVGSGATEGYTWAPATGLNATTGATVIATPATTTTYTVTGTNTGCSITGTATVTVVVNPTSTAPVLTPNSVTTCSGSPTTLSASATTTATVLSSPSNSTGGPATLGTSGAVNANIYPWNIAVSGLPTSGVTVESVTLNGVAHTFPDDLDILLQSPTGTNVILVSDAGAGTDITAVTYTIRDGATPFADAATNPTGTYAPSNYSGTGDETWSSPGPGNLTQASPSLSLFGGNMNGTWRLMIRDDETGDGGSIASWSIRFNIPATISYAWSPNIALSGTTGPNVTASPTGTQTYTVTVSHSANACTRTGTVTVTTVPQPNAGSSNSLTTCSNAAPTNMATLLGSHNAGTWSGPSTVTGDLYDPIAMVPGTYTYTVSAPPCPNATATITVTETTATAWYADDDSDGFGDATDMVLSCDPVAGRVSNSTDCNDAQVQYADGDGDGFGTGSPIACGVANNTDCNDAQIQYADGDGDGFGAGSPVACGVTNSTDCNDAQLQYVDADGDGFGVGSPIACGVANNTDCNDAQIQYADVDGDGFGAGSPVACGGISDNSDCNDAQVQYSDTDNDGFGAGSPVACGVGNNADCNDAQLQYADTDGDGFGAGSPVACGVANNTDDCPSAVGVVGSNCDAQPGMGFVLGQLNGSCNCVAIACTENVVLELRSDANSSEIGYEILDQNTNLVICSGGAPNEAFPNGITTPITPSCCLPVGCYRLRVLDTGGDGFVSGGVTGGYQLRESGVNGRRIIDNLGNFTTGSTSAVASTYENGSFCVPMGNDRPIFTSCDKLDWVNDRFIVATENPAVSAQHGVSNGTSGYEFWFFDPNGSYSFRRFRSHATSDGTGTGATRACHFRINSWVNSIATPHIPANTLLNVRIRGRVAGVNLPFGPACLFKIDATRAACPLVKLQDNPADGDFSCGVNKNFGGPNSTSNKLIAAAPQITPSVPSSSIRYQFRFRLPGEYPNPGSCIVRPMQTSPTIYLNWTSGDKLKCNTQYQVDVRVSKDGGATWCIADAEPTCSANPTVWGKVCSVNIGTSPYCPNNAQGGGSDLALENNGQLTMYPNPNTGEQLFLNLSRVEEGTGAVNVDIFDMTGKRVIARTIIVQDGSVRTGLDLNGDMMSGVYLVNITAGTKTYTERLVIQR
ncbi:MAG: T9SS type A sorting domain-containing protein [Flavobacteriales bacterium]|nr:T9SS type A sorting domain-containing protein [Flavobacteriales bacterium]